MSKPSITCINGTFMPAEHATIPVADRGFRFGDGVFETLALVDGTPYQWQEHINRLNAGLAALRIAAPDVDWASVAQQLIHKNQTTDGFLRIAISRGIGSRGYMPDAEIKPTWVMEIIPATPMPEKPYTLWHGTITRPPLSALPANHKLAHGIGSTLALMEARDQNCDEALLLSHDGNLSECASGNLFWITGEKIYTPALSTACLAGTTRAAILRLSPIEVEEVVANIDSLAYAEAAFISNTRLGVCPIATLAPHTKKFDTAHPVIRDLTARLDADRAAYVIVNRAEWMAT
jgi:aminodeoxychorismate lyase